MENIKKNPNVLVISVNYYADLDTNNLIKDILKQNYSDTVKIIIVNNSNENDSYKTNIDLMKLYKDKENIIILNPGKNLGYFGGANWALSKYLETNNIPEWIIVANTDIIIPENNFFEKLFNLYPNGIDGIIAPSIFSLVSKVDQNPNILTRPNWKKFFLYGWIYKCFFIYFLYNLLSKVKKFIKKIFNYHKNISNLENTSEFDKVIYAPHGSFIVINKVYFELGGNLNYKMFLYGEEIFIAEKIRLLGLKVIYDPRLKVVHKDHITTKTVKNRKKLKYMYEANQYLANQYFKKI